MPAASSSPSSAAWRRRARLFACGSIIGDPQRIDQGGPSPRQPRHHRPDRRADRRGDVAIAQSVYVAHDDNLPEQVRQRLDRRLQRRRVRRGDHRLLGIGRARARVSGRRHFQELRVVRQHDGLRSILGEPGERRIAHDRQQPRARPLDDSGVERGERAHAGVLDDVLRVGCAAREPAGEAIGVVEVRQHQLGETPVSRFTDHSSP